MGTTISSRCHRHVLCAVASSGLDSDLRFSDGMRPESEVRNRLPLEEAEFKPSVPLARVSPDSRGGEGAGGRSDRLETTPSFSRGTSGSNPAPSSGESIANPTARVQNPLPVVSK